MTLECYLKCNITYSDCVKLFHALELATENAVERPCPMSAVHRRQAAASRFKIYVP